MDDPNAVIIITDCLQGVMDRTWQQRGLLDNGKHRQEHKVVVNPQQWTHMSYPGKPRDRRINVESDGGLQEVQNRASLVSSHLSISMSELHNQNMRPLLDSLSQDILDTSLLFHRPFCLLNPRLRRL